MENLLPDKFTAARVVLALKTGPILQIGPNVGNVQKKR